MILLHCISLPLLAAAPLAPEAPGSNEASRFALGAELSESPSVVQDDDWDDDADYPSDSAWSPWYFGVEGGFTTTQRSEDENREVDFDNGYLIGALVGYQFTESRPKEASWAVELEAWWSDQDADLSDDGIDLNASADITTFSGLINGVVDYMFNQSWAVFGGVGLGLSAVDSGDVGDNFGDFDDENGPFLTWQLKAGVRYAFSENTSLQVAYRFVNIDDVEFDDDDGSDPSFDLQTEQHILTVGLLFGF